MSNELAAWPDPPPLVHMTRIECALGAIVSLGRAKYGERRYVQLLNGTANGSVLNGRICDGGVDWQIQRDDGVLEISAHYVIEAADGALIEITSNGYRYGDAATMQRLANGENVHPSEYYFRTIMHFQTGSESWRHLNATMAVAVGQRSPRSVILDVYRIT